MEENKDRKKIIMKAGVISVMILVVVFWVLNLRNMFNNQRLETSQNKQELQSIREDLDRAINKINEGMDKIKETDEKLKEVSGSLANEPAEKTDNVVSSSSDILTPTDLTQTVPDVEVAPAQLETLPQPEKINSNCPSYINCMPTIGEARACRIPAGCEGITQIAY